MAETQRRAEREESRRLVVEERIAVERITLKKEHARIAYSEKAYRLKGREEN